VVKPLQSLFWILRGNEKDIINVYDYLRPVVELANGGYILNRGYWTKDTTDPLQAQYQLCKIIGEFACFHSAKTLLDVGSGVSNPAIHWKSMYSLLDIICLDLNFNQLKTSLVKGNDFYTNVTNTTPDTVSVEHNGSLSHVNASARMLPFASHSIDRIIVLESHQHFKPLNLFIQESKRVLTRNGLFVIASPVKTSSIDFLTEMLGIGILLLALNSKNYQSEYIKLRLKEGGFHIKDILSIGFNIYEPLEHYYTQNRRMLKQNIASKYPPFIEKAIYKLILKAKDAYKKGIIDYLMIKCTPK
jgi:ubiquinone/menaquinone biosynthesis C-methylase UbiE